eukprot:CAMPEP_0172319628 /NCGR_PEP_ID=MMETSP1058-20130122/38166_1 /TAXON_ID=83371 /ORGANISM="Detonula confervacea, Strain CCMP 353" /LENGTH=1607 /DNA_ID=CAMNT_0013034711 /DNA_START=38 /DNA_END=4861 /DNA_ORIENTATION=+
MAEEEDNDDLEDLFSFGATTPGAPSELSKPLSSTGSNFDLLSDVSLTTTPGVTSSPGAAGALSTPRSSGGDDFDALFGTPPPITTATSRTLAIDESPNAAAGGPKHLSIDDFHVHDEDTRDMLDWLDDDNTGKKSKDDSFQDINSNVSGDDDDSDLPPQNNEEAKVKYDDFDFDQMLAGADDATPSPKITANKSNKDTKQNSLNQNEGQPKVVAEAEDPLEDNAGAKPDVSDTTDDSTPMPVSKPPVPACIEDELAFDQWEDDENEEMEDLQLNDAGNDADRSTEKSEGAGSMDASPGHKDGGSAEVKPPSPPKITFSSLSDAIRSNASTTDDVRSLFSRERGGFSNISGDVGVGKEDRAYLWTKVICGKILDDIKDGSLADSYREWEKKGEAAAKFEGEQYGAVIDSLLKQGSVMTKGDEPDEAEKQQLLSLSYFHSRNKSSTSSSLGIDPLIPPVVLAILQAGIPPAAASVVLSHIEPSAMPLLRLGHDERYVAAKALHSDFYLLACYHLPLLVMHLDRHCPGWYWPRKGGMGQHEDETPVDANDTANNDDEKEKEEKGNEDKTNEKAAESNPEKNKTSDLEQNGLVPLSWFVTNFAGECGGSCLDHKHLLQLWDHILTKGDYSRKYFLAIAVLEKNSDVLLMSRGEELKKELQNILEFHETSFAVESFVGASEGKTTNTGDDMTSEWLSSAKSLMESTPSSVIELLRSADDRAVAIALKVHQTKVDEDLQTELDAHEVALTKEREERDKEAERALNKARLTAYYRTYNPDKIDTIEQILKLFDGRMGVLNEKLKNKYGKGFLPDEALKDQTRSFLLSVNQSISETRKHVSVAVSERRKKNTKSLPESRSHTPVVLEVSTTEVMAVICTTKGHNLATGRKMSPLKRTSNTDSALQFYLVDCRPESIAAEEGRFPTAVTLSPEKLQDPDELQKLTDMFESLRGAVHICVMGEGFASFPVLYNHSLSKAEEKLLEDDIARTSNCALFFLKKGFPFVSVLRGGFAAAHAFLSRNGSPMGMAPSDVLIEYDPAVSLFAQLETARQEEDEYKNAPAREKTARTLQRILDNSMVRLTMEEQRLNYLANDLAKPENVDKMKQSVSNFLAKPKTVPSIGFGRTPPLFMTKNFASTKKEGAPEKRIEPTLKEDKGRLATSLTKKMSFKLPSLHSESSSTALSDKESEVDEEEHDTAPGIEPSSGSVPTDASNKGKAEDNANGTSKISSAFTSLTQRMQQSTDAKVAPAAGSGESTLEGNQATKESAGSKISFSNFTNRIKSGSTFKLGQQPADQPLNPSNQVTDTEGSDDTKVSTQEKASAPVDKKENTGGIASDNPSKVLSGFASLTQRMHQSTTTADASDSGQQPATKESTVGKLSFSSFTNRIKLGQQSAAQPPKPVDKASEAKVTEEKNAEKSEEEDSKVGASTDNPADGGRFGKFTKSIGGSLSGLRDKAAEAKVSDEKKDSVKAKTVTSADNPTDVGKFSKFTKSIGGSISGIRNQPARQNPFASMMHSKPESTNPKDDFEGSLYSLGKLMLEDEPLPKTRFQRLEAEESISFDDDNEEVKTASTQPQEGSELNDLFGDPTKELFADVSLTDSNEEKPADTPDSIVEE